MNDRARRSAVPFETGERFARRVRFDADSIRAFATLCGDDNPLHHDERVAATSRFQTLIASGPHVVALMMGLDATFLSRRGEALGLGFEFRFDKAVPAGAELTLEWTICSVEHKPSLRGDVVSVEGQAIDDAGVVYVTATGRNLVSSSPNGDGIRGASPADDGRRAKPAPAAGAAGAAGTNLSTNDRGDP